MDHNLLPLYIVDAFTKKAFAGNPAAVCLISRKHELPDETLQKIAAEMNLSETAFVITSGDEDGFAKESKFHLRWFTPKLEVWLCGHATLASASTLFNCLGNTSPTLEFETLAGSVYASRSCNGLITLDFPRNDPRKLSEEEMQNLQPLVNLIVGELEYEEVLVSSVAGKLMIRLRDNLSRKDLESIKFSSQTILEIDNPLSIRGAIVTLKGNSNNGCINDDGIQYDFISRYFAPWVGILEDPVTGSAHTISAPYWSRLLSKNKLFAFQSSPRGGELQLTVKDQRVEISGNSVVVVKGQLDISRK
ncbi:phenazine biosynthesis-like domain-containing protein 1 [Centruroides vittatus]|uniref:phenazine biosynthesis-like domain-containing protein 1 n=1 Tax=Centruroides vittatus TaxID=120091 RepID=UPI00350F42BD